MPLSQQDAEGIGRNISQALFPSYHERRADRAASADLKRRQALEEMIAAIAQKNAMEQLAAREQGDMERTKFREDREDVRDIRRAGVMSDNARMSVEQRQLEAEEQNRRMEEIAKVNRLARLEEYLGEQRRKNMTWMDTLAENSRKARMDERMFPVKEMEERSRFANSLAKLDQANYGYKPELLEKAGIILRDSETGKPGSGVKAPTRPTFQTKTRPAVTNVDYSVTKDATNVPMPPDENGNRKSSTAGSNAASVIPGGADVRRFIQILTDKSLKPL